MAAVVVCCGHSHEVQHPVLRSMTVHLCARQALYTLASRTGLSSKPTVYALPVLIFPFVPVISETKLAKLQVPPGGLCLMTYA